MTLSHWAMDRPVTTLMLAVCVVVLGTVAFMRLPLFLLPAYDSPSLTVVVPYRSSSPEEIERLIIRPLEEGLGTLTDLQRMVSKAWPSQGRVRLEFAHGTDMDVLTIDVRDRLDRVRADLPQDITNIAIRRWSSEDMPILGFRVGWQGDKARLYDIVLNTIEHRLQAIEGVAKVDVYGVERQTLQIEIDPASLDMHGLTSARLAAILRRNHVSLSGGAVEDGGVRYLLRTLGELQTPAQVANLPLDGKGLRLQDVARVQYTYPPKFRYDRLNREAAITVRVFRSSTANIINVARSVHHTLEAIQQSPGLEPLSIFVYHDSSRAILQRLKQLQRAGLLGMGLALGVLWLFLRHLGVTLVLGIVIPISLLTTFLIMYLLREGTDASLSLNLVSLSGLMMSVGMLVDSSIVVLENIFRHRQAGVSSQAASVVGANEMSRAVLVATATSLVVFLPTIFVDGNWMGRIMAEFGLVVCAVLIAALGVSLTLVPLLSARLLGTADVHPIPPRSRLITSYSAIIRWTLRYRWVVILLAAGIFGLSLHWFMNDILLNRDLSRTPSRRLRMVVETPRGMPFAESRRVMETLENVLLQQRQALEIRHVLTTIRRDGKHRLRVYFREAEQSRSTARALQKRLLDALPQLPGVIYRVRGNAAGSHGQQGITVQLQGPHSDVLARLAEHVKAQLSRIPGVYSVATDIDQGEEELRLAVDRQLAQRHDLSSQLVASTVALAVSERPLTTMTFTHQDVPVTMQVAEEGVLSAEQLQNLPVVAGEPQMSVSVGHLARSQVHRAPKSTQRENRLQTTRIEVRMQDGITITQAARQITQRLSSLTLPSGYHWQLGRSYRRFVEAQKQSTFSLNLAIVFVYLIMAALFESLVLPLAIMLTVPFALSGVVGIFILTGSPFSQMADLGMLLLCGLVVNNGIMLVDAANQLRARGLSRTEALVQSSQQRLRPIVMTAITTLMGLGPMVAPLLMPAFFGPAERYVAFYGPVGLVVVGGLCTSTFLTLLILPAMYALLDDGIVACRQLRHLLMRPTASLSSGPGASGAEPSGSV